MKNLIPACKSRLTTLHLTPGCYSWVLQTKTSTMYFLLPKDDALEFELVSTVGCRVGKYLRVETFSSFSC